MRHARRRFELARVLAGMSCLVGCDHADNAERMMPRLGVSDRPADSALWIPVVVDGRPTSPIDGDLLASMPPRFEDSGRRLWPLRDLLDVDHHARVEIRGRLGLAIATTLDGARAPYLMVNRRGELAGVLVDEAEPFPRYHGTGQRRQRPGDPSPRINDVQSIVITRPAP